MWKSITDSHDDLAAVQLVQLEEACRAKDRLDRLDAILRGAVARGKIVVMTTQVPNEGSDLTVYHVGGRLKSSMNLLEAYDMTTEAAVTKLMWLLGQYDSFEEIERGFYTEVNHDILMA